MIAFLASASQGEGRDPYGRPSSPAGRFYALWTWALALLFLAAVGLSAWLTS